jgi:abortive infection bacteriophage resistance protein
MGGVLFMGEVKPFLNFEEQLEKIRSRGCQIEDAASARQALSITNYYRLSAYFLPFKKSDGSYKLRCCTDLRNICAHHGRLYYRLFSAIPAGLREPYNRRIFGMLLVLKTLYADKTEWNEEIYGAICALVDEYNRDINFGHIGFTDDWRIKLKNC